MQFGDVFRREFQRRRAARAAGSEQEHPGAGSLDAEILAQRTGDGVGIGVKPMAADTVRSLLSLFLAPMLGNSPQEMEDLRNYRLLIALVTNSKTWQDEVFKQHYDPIAVKFIDALAKTLPEVSWVDICWAFSFFLGSVVNVVAETGRIDRLSNGKCRSTDLHEACRQLIQYSVGAFMGLPAASERNRRNDR